MKYSASTLGFYEHLVHGNNIPNDATDESDWDYTYEQLMLGQSRGDIISIGENGYPILISPTPKTKAQLKSEELQSLAKVFNEDKNGLNAAWLAAAVADGTNETTRKDAVIADIAELQTQYDADCAAVRAKYA